MRLGLLVLLLIWSPIVQAGVHTPDVGQGWLVTRSVLWDFLNPDRSDFSAGLRFAAGNGRLFAMPELPMQSLSLDLEHRRRRLSLGWSATGRQLWREDTLDLEFQPVAGPGPLLDVTFDRSVCAGDAARSLLLVAIGIRIPIRDRGAVRYLHDLPWGTRRLPSRGCRPMLSLDYAAEPWLAALGIVRDFGSTPIVGVALHVHIGRDVSLGWRAEPATSQWGCLLGIARGRLLVRTSHLVHDRLGITHRFEMSCGFGAAR